MQFSEQFLNELTSRTQTSHVVGERVKLKHKGGGEHTGLCPFHGEKTPSFSVSDTKGFYHCFGCGAHGTSIHFIMKTQGLSFVETVTKLANQAGMEIPKPDKQQQQRYEKQRTLYDVCEAACQWMQKQLHSPKGASALVYLKNRGISDDAISTFRLGYTQEGSSPLKTEMLKQGFSEQQLLDVGLVIKPDEANRGSYDRFRGRLMFPITDFRGKVVAFGGRILSDGQPKYLNSPETELFHKGNLLYNFHHARQSAYDSGDIIAVEGYMDVIALYEAGFKNVVAPLGTAITEQQLKLMWKVAKEPTLCMDGDNAGKRAMARAANNCLPFLEPGHSLQFALLPTGKDPDDLVKSDGASAFSYIIENATALVDTLWNITLNKQTLETPEQKAHFQQQLLALTELINDSTVAAYYKQHFKNQLWQIQRQSKNTKNHKQIQRKSNITALPTSLSTIQRYEISLTLAAFYHPELLEDADFEESYIHLELSDPNLNVIRSAVLDKQNEQETHDLVQKQEKRTTIDPSIKPDSPLAIAQKAWEYSFANYQSKLVDQEYKTIAHSQQIMSNDTAEQLNELKKQKDALKMLVKSKYLAYEAALED